MRLPLQDEGRSGVQEPNVSQFRVYLEVQASSLGPIVNTLRPDQEVSNWFPL